MFRLTREVRFAINTAAGAPAPERPPTNSYAGYPSLSGLGHYFTLAVTLAGDLDPDSHYLENIKQIDQTVRHLAIPFFDKTIRHAPSRFGAPLLAETFDLLKNAWPPARLERLKLSLSPFCSLSLHATERPMMRLSQKFEFAASHRLHNPALSDEQNRQTFGKCNNPHGHGHNYVLEVTVAGEPDPATGMVLDLKELKDILQREVTDRMDHRFLNYEVPELAGQIPTCENIASVIWRLLEPKITRGHLNRVRLYETPDLFVDCYGKGNGATGGSGAAR
jgi:6-pyruvoyltetrahydropterin/6-carboxytetrahydropterin synthase